MKNSKYWAKRFEQLEEASHQYGLDAYREIEPAFDRALRDIENEINAWYGRFASNNEITIQEAKRLLNTKELKELKWDIDDYIKHGRENAINKQWVKELENASAKYHISRLEALKIRTQQAAEVAFGNELDQVDAMARKVYTENYYHSIFEMQKGFNVGWDVGQIDEKTLSKLISKPWAVDGKNFSDRIWESRSKLISEVHTQLTRNCILGKGPDDAIKAIANKFNVSKNQAGRLVMTEEAYFHSASQKEAYNDLDVEEYEIVATLDSHTSDICREMDGKHFPMKEYSSGVTAPPFHPWCRSVTAPYFNDEFSIGERAARGEDGKTYYVPSNMTYPEWKKSMVDGETAGLQSLQKNGIIKMGKLSEQSKLGADHASAMKDILSDAPSNAQKVWNKYSDRIDVEDAHSRRGAWCSYTNGITLNIDKVSKGEKTVSRITGEWVQAKKPYYTAFHEFGHNISALMAKDVKGINYGDISDIYRSKKFKRTVLGINGEEQVGYTLTEMMKHEGLEYFNSIFDKMKMEAKAKGLSVRTVRKYQAWQVIKDEILAKPIQDCTDISDMWDGISNGSCLAHYGHTNQKKKYWSSISVGTEAFAEMFSATVMNPGSVKEIKHYFPQSYEIFIEILEEMGADL